MPSLPELKAVHAEMLELLILFDGLCRKYGVNYTLDAGTLLGAVREGGFIPWDDDVDVALTRAEYEKFRDAARGGPTAGICDVQRVQRAASPAVAPPTRQTRRVDRSVYL